MKNRSKKSGFLVEKARGWFIVEDEPSPQWNFHEVNPVRLGHVYGLRRPVSLGRPSRLWGFMDQWAGQNAATGEGHGGLS